MANLKDLNDGGELTSVITCRVPADMKGDAIKAAAKEKLTLSQWMALLVERALDPKNSILVGRDELNQANAKAKALAKQLSDLNPQIEKQNTSFRNAINKAATLEKSLSEARSTIKAIEARLKEANAHIKEQNIFGKPKQF